MKYAVVDIETTGGNPRANRITEIAVFVYENGAVVSEFVSLVNPECSIPPFISQLTGITNDMVASAPRFFEIARELVEITTDCVFVAHNAPFDYGFIQHEFKSLGFDFNREVLCTVKLSRKIIPGKPSYSLGNLCSMLGIIIDGRHRAAGDAFATVKLFDLLLNEAKKSGLYPTLFEAKKQLPDSINPDIITALPEHAGVFFFYDNHKRLIFVGTGKNIKQDVLSQLCSRQTKRTMEMLSSIASIDYELTGNELIALLQRAELIKLEKPKYNSGQRWWGIFSYYDQSGYLRFKVDRYTSGLEPVHLFSSKEKAGGFLQEYCDQYELCLKLCGLYETSGACFYSQTGKCHGACTGEESPEAYNDRAKKVLSQDDFGGGNFLVIGAGKHDDERSVVKVVKGKYCGFGYFDVTQPFYSPAEIADAANFSDDNCESRAIIRKYLVDKQLKPISRLNNAVLKMKTDILVSMVAREIPATG